MVGVGGVDDDDGGDGLGGSTVSSPTISMLLADGPTETTSGRIDVLACDFWIVHAYRYGCFLLMN